MKVKFKKDYLPLGFEHFKIKDKTVPLQAWSGPEGSRRLRFPDFMTMAHNITEKFQWHLRESNPRPAFW